MLSARAEGCRRESGLSVEELSRKGSPQCKEAFEFLREQLRADTNVQETIEHEPLKESEAPSYNVRETHSDL